LVPGAVFYFGQVKIEMGGTKMTNAERKAEREWQDQQERKKAWTKEHRHFGKRIHFHDQPYVWKSMEQFRAEKKRGTRALCEFRFYDGAKLITKDQSQVTCGNCLRLIQEHADRKGFPRPTKDEKEKDHLRASAELLPMTASVRHYSTKYKDGGYYVTLYAHNEEEIRAIAVVLQNASMPTEHQQLEVVAASA
jgi:hypothetical protein